MNIITFETNKAEAQTDFETLQGELYPALYDGNPLMPVHPDFCDPDQYDAVMRLWLGYDTNSTKQTLESGGRLDVPKIVSTAEGNKELVLKIGVLFMCGNGLLTSLSTVKGSEEGYGRSAYYFLGGKKNVDEDGKTLESDAMCATREIWEEARLFLDGGSLRPVLGVSEKAHDIDAKKHILLLLLTDQPYAPSSRRFEPDITQGELHSIGIVNRNQVEHGHKNVSPADSKALELLGRAGVFTERSRELSTTLWHAAMKQVTTGL